MNKTEFLDLLRYYFRNAKKSEVEEILADYEAHFEEGKKRGLTEEAIAKELGSPKDIYESYASEGVVDEKSKGVRFTDDAKEAAQEAAAAAARKAGKAWDEVSPKLPAAAERAALLTSRLLYGTSLHLHRVCSAARRHASARPSPHDEALHRRRRSLLRTRRLPHRPRRQQGPARLLFQGREGR